jgi:hypothetical protein
MYLLSRVCPDLFLSGACLVFLTNSLFFLKRGLKFPVLLEAVSFSLSGDVFFCALGDLANDFFDRPREEALSLGIGFF